MQRGMRAGAGMRTSGGSSEFQDVTVFSATESSVSRSTMSLTEQTHAAACTPLSVRLALDHFTLLRSPAFTSLIAPAAAPPGTAGAESRSAQSTGCAGGHRTEGRDRWVSTNQQVLYGPPPQW